MRPLNRPMFKNGGPIKEGIMSGMKEPQALNTVGSPFAPKDASGRQGYALQFAPFIYAAGRALLRPLGKFAARQFAGPVNKATPIKNLNLNLKGTPIKGGFQSKIFEPNIAGRYLMQSPEGRFIMGASGKAGAAGKKVMGVTKSLAKSPLTVGSAGIYGGKAIYDRLTKEKTPEAQAEIEAAGGPPGGGDPEMFSTPKQSKADADKIAKDRIEANRKYYYNLMGLDKAKKDDVYRGLIDASNIIQEEGADLKGSIKSGTLQNRIINALSKQLDKSADLKKQIDAAILKGEITKDIEQSKVPDNIRTARMLGISDEEYKNKILGKGDLSEDLLAFANKQGSFPAGNQLAGFARNRGIPITGVEDSQAVKDWMEANSSNEEGYIKSLVKEGKVPDGTYVINKRIFQVNGQDITSIV